MVLCQLTFKYMQHQVDVQSEKSSLAYSPLLLEVVVHLVVSDKKKIINMIININYINKYKYII